MATLTPRTPLRPTITWRVVLIGVLAAACGDATGGILAGDTTHRVAASTSPFSPAAITGALLLTVALVGQLAAHHAIRTGHHRPLRLCLTVLVVWYAGCAAAMLTASLLHGHLVNRPVLVLAMLLAAAGCWTARTTARQIGR
jgi:hypothetical protein